MSNEAVMDSREGQIVTYVLGIMDRVMESPHHLTDKGWQRFALIEDRLLSGEIELPTAEEILSVMLYIDASCTKDQMMDVCEEIVNRLGMEEDEPQA